MRALALVSCLALSACGGSIAAEANPADAAATEVGNGGSDVAIGPVLDEGVPPSTTEAGPATPACARTNDRIEIAVSGAGQDGKCLALGPGDTGPPERSFTGQIVSTDVALVKVDLCHPAADCISSIATITARAPGLDLRSMKKGSFVRVTASFEHPWSCTSMLTIESVAEWGGMKNPVDGAKTYLVASDGRYGTARPFNVELVRTNCMSGKTCGGLEADWYKLRFIAIGGGPPTVLGMGETGTFWAGGQTFAARNLRSFYEGLCDAYWDFAWYATSF